MTLETPTRPIVRYHGGKWLLAPWVIDQFPGHRTYVEPFGGAASVLLRKPRSHAEIYNEKDGEMVNLFRVARDHGEELRDRLELTPYAREEFKASYVATLDPIEQARRTVVRSFMGFGSAAACGAQTGFRSQSHGSGGTPATDWANYTAALKAIIARLRGVVIENRDAIECMLAHDSETTLHYVDPPYVMDTRKMRNPHCKKGYRFELTNEDHARLAKTLNELAGAVIVSGYPSELYDVDFFAGWHRIEREHLADGARARTEVLWMRNVDHGLLC